MEGRRFERVADGASSGEARAADLADLNEASRYRDRMVPPVAGLFVILQAALWIGAAIVLRGGGRRWRSVAALAALTMLAYLPATYLARLIDFYDAARPGAYWLFVFAVAITVAVAGDVDRPSERPRPAPPVPRRDLRAAHRRHADRCATPAERGVRLLADGRRAVRGDGQPRLRAVRRCRLPPLRAVVAAAGPPTRTRPLIAFGVLVVAVLIDGMPIWGSDVGGVLAMVPAVGVTAARMFGQRLRWRTAVIWGSAAVAAVGAFARSTSPVRRTGGRTSGRLVESIGDQGFGAFESVVRRKLEANFSVIASSVWTAMVPVALGFILYLLWRAPGHLREIREHDRREPARAGHRRVPRVRPQRLGDRGPRRDARGGQCFARVPHRSHGRRSVPPGADRASP